MPQGKADTLRLVNGRIYRSAYDDRPASALLIHGGRIAWVGDQCDAPAAAATIDLGGAAVLPGLTDAHVHLLAMAQDRLQISLAGSQTKSLTQLLTRLVEGTRDTRPGEWIFAGNFDEGALAEQRYPTRQELDTAVPNHPVLIRRFCGHVAVVNSQALRLLGIDDRAADPAGGAFGRTPDGRLDGSAREVAADQIFRSLPATDRSKLSNALLATLQQCSRLGIVAAVEAAVGYTNGFDQEFAVWRSLRETQPSLPLRLGFMNGLDPADATARGLTPERDDEWQSMTLKFFADGIVGARTAAMTEPYCDCASQGFFTRDEAELARVINEAHELQWQVAIHAIGDRAVAHILSSLAEAQRRYPRVDARHRIEHCFCPPADGLIRMRELGAVMVMQPAFLTRMRNSILNAFGARAHGYYPGRSALEAGIHYAASSDAPAGLISPWSGIADAVDRAAHSGEPIGPREAMSAREAVASYTLGGAYAMKQETWRGRLVPGMAADLIVVDRDPFAAVPNLRSTNTLLTIVRGEVRHNTHFCLAIE